MGGHAHQGSQLIHGVLVLPVGGIPVEHTHRVGHLALPDRDQRLGAVAHSQPVDVGLTGLPADVEPCLVALLGLGGHALGEGAVLFVLGGGGHELGTGDEGLIAGGEGEGLGAPDVDVGLHELDLILTVQIHVGEEGGDLAVAGEGLGQAVARGGQVIQQTRVGGLVHVVVEALLQPRLVLLQDLVSLGLVVADLVDDEGVDAGIVQVVRHAAVIQTVGQTVGADAVLQQEIVVDLVEIPVLVVVHATVLVGGDDGPVAHVDGGAEGGLLGEGEGIDVDVDLGGLDGLAALGIRDRQIGGVQTGGLIRLGPDLHHEALGRPALDGYGTVHGRQAVGDHVPQDGGVMLSQELGLEGMAVAVGEVGEGDGEAAVSLGGQEELAVLDAVARHVDDVGVQTRGGGVGLVELLGHVVEPEIHRGILVGGGQLVVVDPLHGLLGEIRALAGLGEIDIHVAVSLLCGLVEVDGVDVDRLTLAAGSGEKVQTEAVDGARPSGT